MQTPKNKEDILAEFREAHGDTYIYPSNMLDNYRTMREKLTIVCRVHGQFQQTAEGHRRGRGCPECGRTKLREGKSEPFRSTVKRANKVHSNAYTYLEVKSCVGEKGKLKIICPKHGVFVQRKSAHLSGQGCPKCGAETVTKKLLVPWPKLRERMIEKHQGKYQYLEPENYAGYKSTLIVVCPVHGEFAQNLGDHLRGRGCPSCFREGRRSKIQDVVSKALITHEGRYDYCCHQDYESNTTKLSISCPTHGWFLQSSMGHLAGQGCPKCSNQTSKQESEVRAFIESLGLETQKGRDSILPGLGRMELDIIIPEKKFAVEFDGLFWHSEKMKKDAKWHLVNKTKLVNSLDYTLVHIYSDEWETKRPQVEGRLKSLLGVPGQKVGARSTYVAKISWQQASRFLEKTHLQGAGRPAKYCYGLKDGHGVLRLVATFGKARYGNSGWELLRLASIGRVVGGLGKVISAFSKDETNPGESLISYADRRWSAGHVYKALDFTFEGYSEPGYAYTRRGVRFNRENFQKHKLAKLFDDFDPKLTEAENCNRNGYYRIYDCGTSKWRKIL